MMVSGSKVLQADGQSVAKMHYISDVVKMFDDKYGYTISDLDGGNILINYANGHADANWTAVTGALRNTDGSLIVAFSGPINSQIRVDYQYIVYVDVYDNSKWDNSVLSGVIK